MKENKVKDTNRSVFMGKQWWKNFGHGVMPTLSKLSKAFLLPIALLPIAGIFLGVGATIANQFEANTAGWYIGTVINKMGDVCFGNLPVLFCISVAIAYTEDSGVAGITAVVGFLVMNGIQGALLTQVLNADKELVNYTLLWWGNVDKMLVTSNIGVNSLNTGVFAAIFVGAISAKMYNRFHKTQLPAAISFFSGSKLVPIITFIAVVPLSFIFMFTWPAIGMGLAWIGQHSGDVGYGVDSLLFEIVERSLVPFGLHHVFYAPLWWSGAGGDLGQTLQNNQSFKLHTGATFGTVKELLEHYKNLGPDAEWLKQTGDQYILNAIISHSKELNFTDLEKMGLNIGRFQSGKFGFMLLGLPAAGLAMWLNVPKENRKNVMGIYFSAAFTCFLTGITEPIEYTFLFLAPWLFYGVHMPIAAVSFLLTGLMKVHVGMTVSGGFIDYIVFGLIPMSAGTNWFHVIWIAGLLCPIYFFAFYFCVKYAKVMVPGRDGNNLATLFKKVDYKDKKAAKGSKTEAAALKAAKIIELLGGESNITGVDSCASRLRLTVVDSKLADVDAIKALGGSTGALVRGQSIHIVYGGEQEVLKPHMKEILAEMRAKKEA